MSSKKKLAGNGSGSATPPTHDAPHGAKAAANIQATQRAPRVKKPPSAWREVERLDKRATALRARAEQKVRDMLAALSPEARRLWSIYESGKAHTPEATPATLPETAPGCTVEVLP